MYNTYYIDANKLNELTHRLARDYHVFSPAVKGPNPNNKEIDYVYRAFSNSDPLVYNPYRIIEPLKAFFTHPKEKIAEFFHTNKDIIDLSKTIIFGVKNCDINAHKIQDFVFLEGVETDSLYRTRRDNTILISGDCTDFKTVCFCLALEILPHPTSGFDLNLSPIDDGYLVEAGSKKGEALVRQYREYFGTASEAYIALRDKNRKELIERLKAHLLPQGIPAKDSLQRLVKEGYNFDTWQQFMLTCVECGGCNLICDTCHCFLLSDEKENYHNEKIRSWDSCLYANYARVAGGANALKTRTQRLRNRFMKKFDFFVDNLGMPACCGCGRCIEVCPGKIDIREVLKDLAKKIPAKEE